MNGISKGGKAKKAITLLLAATLILSLAACSGGNGNTPTSNTPDNGGATTTTPPIDATPTPETILEPTSWELSEMVDDFGDPIGIKVIRSVVTGTFSNTATNGADLNVVIFCQLNTSLKGDISIRLLEYKDHKATFISSDELTMKTKVDDNVTNLTIKATPPNSDIDIPSSTLYDYLYDGKEVSCVIDIGNSTYKFTIDGNGFAEIFDEVLSESIVEVPPIEQGTITGTVDKRVQGQESRKVWIITVEESDIDIIESGKKVAVYFDEATYLKIKSGDNITLKGEVFEPSYDAWLIEGAKGSLRVVFDIISIEVIEHNN